MISSVVRSASSRRTSLMVWPPLPVLDALQSKGRRSVDLKLSPEQVAAVVADSTLGRLQKRYDTLLKVRLPSSGLETIEQARSAAQLSTTFDNLQKRRAELGLEPLPKSPKVADARRLSTAFYRKARANKPSRSTRSSPRAATPA